MDLHGQVTAGVEKLEEQREGRPRRVAAEEFVAPLPHERAERRAGEQPGRDHALVGAAVDEFPRLGVVVAGRQFAAEGRGETATAPQVAAVERAEHERGHHGPA
jgi:hypothetical protein